MNIVAISVFEIDGLIVAARSFDFGYTAVESDAKVFVYEGLRPLERWKTVTFLGARPACRGAEPTPTIQRVYRNRKE